jgi:osmotically inducible lipoprotein OsmB
VFAAAQCSEIRLELRPGGKPSKHHRPRFNKEIVMNTTRKLATLGVALALASALGGCGNLSRQDKSTIGGAAIGGVAGSVMGGGAIGTVGGAAVGGVIGHEVGKDKR